MSRTVRGRVYLTSDEVIKRIGVSKRTLLNWTEKINNGKFQGRFHLRITKCPIGGTVYYLEEDIQKYEELFEKSLK